MLNILKIIANYLLFTEYIFFVTRNLYAVALILINYTNFTDIKDTFDLFIFCNNILKFFYSCPWCYHNSCRHKEVCKIWSNY